MNSRKYWEERAAKRMHDYIAFTEDSYNLIAGSYLDAASIIEKEIEKVFKNFKEFTGISMEETERLLTREYSGHLLEQLRKIANKISEPQKRQELLNIINAPSYTYRINRWEKLNDNISEYMESLSRSIGNSVSSLLWDIAKQAYYHSMFDLQQGMGYGYSFTNIPDSRIREILSQPWSAEHYSSRIWNNTENLVHQLKKELLTGFLTGRSYSKTAEKIQELMASGSMQSKRIVRTEANYIANQAELETYKESGVKWYLYCAVLDLKTSEICRKLDGKRYLVKNAKPRLNYPPMHPWCRSTTIIYSNSKLQKDMKRRAFDPKTGKTILVSATINYDQWYEKYVEPVKNRA